MPNINVILLIGKQSAIKIVALPRDTNASDSIFGGWIMSQIDIARAVAALERAKCKIVTVAVNMIEFHEPIFIGDLISCYAEVIKTGITSITVKVEVYAERHSSNKLTVKVTEAELVYVAIDENHKPRKLSDLETE
tara:strand:- start:195 stop:602 length:408 start_codon:yes stop_codon:yes gene_type:complete